MDNDAGSSLTVSLLSASPHDSDPICSTAAGNNLSSPSNDAKDATSPPSSVDGDCTGSQGEQSGKVTALSLAMIIFYNASGGPFGTEPSVKAAGNLYAIIGLALMPLLWAAPEVYMTYRLSTQFPCASGGALWVEKAFGSTVGLMVGYLGWLGGVVMAASYPALLYEYVMSQFFPDKGASEVNPLARYGAVLGMALLLSFINYRGLSYVGKASTLMYLLTMSPFFIMVIVGFTKVEPSKWLQTPPIDNVEVFDDDSVEEETHGWLPLENVAGIAFRPFINNLYWNFNNFDQAGHYSSSVPKTIFQRGLTGSLFLVASAYVLPILAATGATDLVQDDWKPGTLAVVGSEIAGNWLGVWIVISSGVSLASCFFAEVSADSLQLLGMADRQKIPRLFGHQSRFGTPTYSLMACLVVIASVLPFDFGVITELCNFGYCLSVTVEFLAFAKLQIRQGDASIRRKILYTIMLVPPMSINIMIFLLASFTTYIYAAVMILLGLLVISAGAIKSACSRSFFSCRVGISNTGLIESSSEKISCAERM